MASFAHGQLYVALSRVAERAHIAVLCAEDHVKEDAAGVRYVVTTNVVERTQLVASLPAHLRGPFRATYPAPMPPPDP
jgi:hypothetical protein